MRWVLAQVEADASNSIFALANIAQCFYSLGDNHFMEIPMRHALFPAALAALLSFSAFAAEPVKEKNPAPVLASAALTDALTGDYVLDKSHASIVFSISHAGYSRYTGRFNMLDAQLNFDAKDVTQSTLKATVAPGSVDANNSTLEAELASKNWFNAVAFPEAMFVARKIKKTGAATGKITGDLTLMGITKPLVLDVVFNGGGNFMQKDKIGFSAKTTLKRSDFGIIAYLPIVGDRVTLDIEVEFVRDDGEA